MTLKGIKKLCTRPHIFIRDYLNKIRGCKKNKVNNLSEFSINNLIDYFDSLKIKGLYIPPINKDLKWVIATLDKDKQDVSVKLLDFIEKNNIKIRYKVNNTIKEFQSPFNFFYDISSLNSVDIRFAKKNLNGLSYFWFRLEFWEEHEDFYLATVPNYISMKLWKDVADKHKIFKEHKLINYQSILNKPHEFSNTLEIDLVFTWVNSEDEDWKKMYSLYKPSFKNETDSASTSRFYNRDELKYALRSWDKYGKFIRNIYIVSNCKPPRWLNLEMPNIKWVYHEEIMPKEVLPTFSSHAIETSLHKIEGLSNYFIYSNDDILLTRPSDANDYFFSNGIVKLKLEPYGNVNGFVKNGDPDYLNAARNSTKLLEKTFNKTPTQLHTHSSQAMRVDLLKDMENLYYEEFQKTLNNKFRTPEDISVASYLYPHYAYLSGNAIQSNIKVELIKEQHNFKKKFCRILDLTKNKQFNKLPLSVCINDGGDSHLNDEWNEEVLNFLEKMYPQPSKYEKII